MEFLSSHYNRERDQPKTEKQIKLMNMYWNLNEMLGQGEYHGEFAKRKVLYPTIQVKLPPSIVEEWNTRPPIKLRGEDKPKPSPKLSESNIKLVIRKRNGFDKMGNDVFCNLVALRIGPEKGSGLFWVYELQMWLYSDRKIPWSLVTHYKNVPSFDEPFWGDVHLEDPPKSEIIAFSTFVDYALRTKEARSNLEQVSFTF